MIEEFNGDFLQWIRGFYYVARTGSITRAARKMNRSQSSVSYQIQCLERQLNVSLFDRINNRLKITPQGVRLLDWTIVAFELLDELEEGISASCDELNGKVGISGSMPIIGQDMFSRLLSRFRASASRRMVATSAPASKIPFFNMTTSLLSYGSGWAGMRVPICGPSHRMD